MDELEDKIEELNSYVKALKIFHKYTRKAEYSFLRDKLNSCIASLDVARRSLERFPVFVKDLKEFEILNTNFFSILWFVRNSKYGEGSRKSLKNLNNYLKMIIEKNKEELDKLVNQWHKMMLQKEGKYMTFKNFLKEKIAPSAFTPISIGKLTKPEKRWEPGDGKSLQIHTNWSDWEADSIENAVMNIVDIVETDVGRIIDLVKWVESKIRMKDEDESEREVIVDTLLTRVNIAKDPEIKEEIIPVTLFWLKANGYFDRRLTLGEKRELVSKIRRRM